MGHGSEWFTIPDDSTLYYPTGLQTSLANTRTAIFADSDVKDWDVVVIDRLIVHTTTTAGTVVFAAGDDAHDIFTVQFGATGRWVEIGLIVNRLKTGLPAGQGGFAATCDVISGTAAVTIAYTKVKRTDNLA